MFPVCAPRAQGGLFQVKAGEFFVKNGGGWLAAGNAIEGSSAAEEEREQERGGEHDGDQRHDAEEESGGFLDLCGASAAGNGGDVGVVVNEGEEAMGFVADGVSADKGNEGSAALDLDGGWVGVLKWFCEGLRIA
uniref:Uncharacterized protein n=1 Tax=mine drainage metagenome TaxID=410659 RepID=E6QK45_9ZZZZ